MGSSEINLFNAAADAPGIPISIGIRTADNRKRTADSGLWLVAPTRTPPQQEEWRRGKVLSEEKSSKVKSSQVKSAAATYSTWADFLSDLRTAKNIKLPQLPRQRSEVLRHFHLHSHPQPPLFPFWGKLGAHKKLPVSRWSAARGGQLERGTLNLFGSCYICGINIVSDRYTTRWIDGYIDRAAISDIAAARRQSFNRSFVLFAASSAADAYQNSM